MFTKRIATTLPALLAGCLLLGVGGLRAAPQTAPDASGVTVDTGDAALMHRSAVAYPDAARAKGVQGTVILELTLDATGSVADARVLSGPEDLRRAALSAVLDWHFAREAGGTVRQVRISFDAAAAAKRPAAPPVAHAAAMVPHAGSVPVQGTLKTITVSGLSDALRADLLSHLPVHEGDTVTLAEAAPRITQAVKEFDEHLTVSLSKSAGDEFTLRIAAPGAPAAVQHLPAVAHSAAPGAGAPGQIKVGGSVQQTKLVSQARPTYPADAKAAGVQGLVRMQAVINRDGTIKSLEVMEGPPMLVPAALEAVKQWVYQPTLLNGAPVEVITQIDVNFVLAK